MTFWEAGSNTKLGDAVIEVFYALAQMAEKHQLRLSQQMTDFCWCRGQSHGKNVINYASSPARPAVSGALTCSFWLCRSDLRVTN